MHHIKVRKLRLEYHMHHMAVIRLGGAPNRGSNAHSGTAIGAITAMMNPHARADIAE